MRWSFCFAFAASLASGITCLAQDVVSASAGVVQYFEGRVLVDDNPVEHKAGVFASLKNGSVVRTEKGRAELLLTPGVYLRLDENSAFRMVSNSLSDTRLELTHGAAILDSLNASSNPALSISYQGADVRFPHAGIFRIDSELSELQVYSGNCSVKNHGVTTAVDSAHIYYFTLELTVSKFGDGTMDEFYDWAANRSNVLADQSQATLAEQTDAQDADAGAASGMYVVPPIYTSPSTSYGSYNSGLNQFYLYPPTPYSAFNTFSSVIFLVPRHYAPGVTRLPGSTVGVYRPIITRWPTSPAGTVSRFPATQYHPSYLTQRPAPTVAPHAAAPRAATPHVGHR